MPVAHQLVREVKRNRLRRRAQRGAPTKRWTSYSVPHPRSSEMEDHWIGWRWSMNTMGHRLCCKHKKWDFNVWKYSFRINTQHSLAAAGSWTNLCSTSHIVFIPNTFPDHPSCGSLLNWYWKVTNGWMSGGWNYIWKSVAAARSAALTQLSVERTCRIAAFSLNNEPEKITKKSSKGN